MNLNDIARLNLSELINLSDRFDGAGFEKEADFCDKLAAHVDKFGMARSIPGDFSKLKEDAPDLKVNMPGRQSSANYVQLTNLIGEDQNNRITMASEELTRIPNFSAQGRGPKPIGLWYACGNEWLYWLTGEMPQWIGSHVYSLKIDESKMLIIKSWEEFRAFENEFLVDDPAFGKVIDWAKVAMKYSGIEICPYQSTGRMSSNWYYGWDVASGCVWEGSVVSEATLVAKKASEVDRTGREDSWDDDRPIEGESANWDWFGLGGPTAPVESTEASPEEKETIKEISEKAIETMTSEFVSSVSQDDKPWSRPWGAPGQAGRGQSVTDRPYHGTADPGSVKGESPLGKTAESVKVLEGFKGNAILYRLSEPLDGNQYVVVSSSNVPFTGDETYIFGANSSGEVEDWGELQGSTPGILCHTTALKNAGYEVV